MSVFSSRVNRSKAGGGIWETADCAEGRVGEVAERFELVGEAVEEQRQRTVAIRRIEYERAACGLTCVDPDRGWERAGGEGRTVLRRGRGEWQNWMSWAI